MLPASKTALSPKSILWRIALTLFILALLAGPGAQVFQSLLLK